MSNDHALDTAAKVVDYIAARYQADAPRPPDGLVIPTLAEHVHFVAFGFATVDPEVFRRVDPRTFPADCNLEMLRSGCAQIAEWRGFSADRPIEGLGIRGFNDLVRLLGLTSRERSTQAVGDGVFLDEMHMLDRTGTSEITLYNLVDHTKPPAASCPHCGKPLRTATAKQCQSCGKDWHDPANVISRNDATES